MKKFLLLLIVLLSCPITGQAGQLLMPYDNNGLYNYRTTIAVQEEFLGAGSGTGLVGSLGWGLSGGTTTIIASEVNRYGLLHRETSAVINTVATTFLSGSNNAVNPSVDHTLLYSVRSNQIDADTTLRIGLYENVASNPPANGIYFEKLNSDTNWMCVTRNAGVSTRVDSGIVATTQFVTLSYNKSASGVDYTIDNSPVCGLITTNIPTTFLDPTLQIVNTAAANKTLDIDYFLLVIRNIVR